MPRIPLLALLKRHQIPAKIHKTAQIHNSLHSISEAGWENVKSEKDIKRSPGMQWIKTRMIFVTIFIIAVKMTKHGKSWRQILKTKFLHGTLKHFPMVL